MKKNPIEAYISNRRAIYPKMFSGEVIPKDQIIALLEAANWAPSHKHSEPWRFVVFSGLGLENLASFQANLYKNNNQSNFKEEKHQKLLTKPLLSSHIIAVIAKKTDVVPHQEDICATSCAVQNLWLTASAMGLGCYWSTGGSTYDEAAKPFFGMEQGDTLLGFINLGMMEKSWPSSKRGPLENKVTWVDV
jgi:nitroreductase